MAENKKKLTVTAVKKHNKKFRDQMEIIVGDEYYLMVDKEFRPTKIAAVSHDLMQIAAEYRNLSDELVFTGLIYILILKHFSSLEVPEDPEKLLTLQEELIDSGFLQEILEKLPEEEVNKVMTKVRDMIVQISERAKLFKETADDMIENGDFENEEVVKILQEVTGNIEQEIEETETKIEEKEKELAEVDAGDNA